MQLCVPRIADVIGDGGAVMYTVDDIQIFIPTYNRPALLGKMIDSLLAQTARPGKIVVLDNGGHVETQAVVDRYAHVGVCSVNTSALGHNGNMLMAKQLADRAYVALFHDDDQLHPDYLSHVIHALNTHSEIGRAHV